MCADIEITEDDVKLWLCAGTDVEAERAISHIHRTYGDKVINFLNKEYPGLPLEDKETALSQTYETLWREGRSGRLNINKSLACVILTTAYRRAADLMRCATRQKRTLPDEQYHQQLADAIHGGSIGSAWKILENHDLARQVTADFKKWLATLPVGQRSIAYIIADGFPDLLGPREVFDILMKTGREPPSYESVKRAYRVTMDKFKKVIESKYEEVWS